MDEELNEILHQMHDVDNGINNMIVPILKDTINDYKKTFNKMVIIVILLILGLLAVISYSQYLIYKQNREYKDFLSQFDFESEIYQDTDNNSTINSGITVNK